MSNMPEDTQHKLEILNVRLATEPTNHDIFLQRAYLYADTGNIDDALDSFGHLMQLTAHQLKYLAPFCMVLHKNGFSSQAAELYDDYCHRFPKLASLFYNHAFYLRLAGKYTAAIAQYQHALELNISEPEEVLLNIAVIYSDHLRQEDKARQALLLALQVKQDYVPALYNLANLAEERGDKIETETLFRQVLEADNKYYQAYARLADVVTFRDVSDPLIAQMQQAVTERDVVQDTRINLHYALGKAFDECGSYADAFSHFTAANKLNSTTMPAYDAMATEHKLDQITQILDHSWLSEHMLGNDAVPIFICGMFRSGSTLAEQILAQHSKVTAGGEIDFFYQQLKNIYPEQFATVSTSDLTLLANRYLEYCNERFPSANLLTDKRPDNYQYMGLLKALFPGAKFIYTKRNKIDNCLSVFFLRLGSAMNYANRLEDTLHYYQQHEKLMEHWQQMFGQDIYTLDYDQLILQPEATLKPLLAFLGLEYQPGLLHFFDAKNAVKTASVWQVRRPLYQNASGRRHNYSDFL
ncbi:tetratricopeptide repeat-containing sulfotransferase family protein [Rheinheimera hassiensis]|uniref:tetratricopeptide repeat-containing sulfotransferase family protein n=1 Tax=Rheinheimera hassiensis TaxID=1193627 RepID=UPI001F054353|nr:tetratricopeptide repeat-containing sulfotransferase family protein [Rheinheimera hassiensis]